MNIHHEDDRVQLWHGDAIEVLAQLPDASVDSVVCDPPYGLEFMGKDWDAPWKASGTVLHDPSEVGGFQDGNGGNAYSRSRVRYGREGGDSRAFGEWCELWTAECLRVLKPGGHMLAFGGTRTWHRLACAVEDAGFEVRDSIAWLYGSGFPKSLDVSKAIDKRPGVTRHAEFARHLSERREAAGLTRADVSEAVVGTRTGACWNWEHHQFPEAKWWPALRDLLDLDDATWGPVIAEAERQKIGTRAGNRLAVAPGQGEDRSAIDLDVTSHATEAAQQWAGWGTALKPSHEPVVVARKPAGPAAILDTIGSQLGALEEACRRRVSGAARSSARTRADSSVARTATAPASAATQHGAGQEPTTATGEAGGSSAATVTSASEWTAETFLSTVTSWRECLAEIYEATSTSTTSTATSRTTDLQTLSSCLSSIMQSVTAQSILDPRSWSSLATAADNLFAAGVLSSRSTLALSAIESATSATPEDSPPAAGSPAFEPVVVARKPLSGTVAANVLEHGTGALNIDACRVGMSDADRARIDNMGGFGSEGWTRADGTMRDTLDAAGTLHARDAKAHTAGRWPTNVLLDDTQAAELDRQSGESKSGKMRAGTKPKGERNTYGQDAAGGYETQQDTPGDTGGASRFFPTFRYEAKAPSSERPRIPRNVLRLRADLTPAQVDHVRARLTEAGVQVD